MPVFTTLDGHPYHCDRLICCLIFWCQDIATLTAVKISVKSNNAWKDISISPFFLWPVLLQIKIILEVGRCSVSWSMYNKPHTSYHYFWEHVKLIYWHSRTGHPCTVWPFKVQLSQLQSQSKIKIESRMFLRQLKVFLLEFSLILSIRIGIISTLSLTKLITK